MRQQPVGRAVFATAVAVVAFILLLQVHPGGATTGRAIDDLGQMAAALVASVAAGLRATRSSGRARLSWVLIGAGTACWAFGEAGWSYFELLADRATPFPSPADAGFLLFPVAAAAGLLLRPSAGFAGASRWRAVLDSVLVAASLFILTWVTALGQVVRAGVDTALTYSVSLAYPVTDLGLVTLTVIVVSRVSQGARASLWLLALGFTSLSVADSGFAYLTANDGYSTGSFVDICWFGGFLLLAAAAVTDTTGCSDTIVADGIESTAAALLPYVPAGLGLLVATIAQLSATPDRITVAASAFVMLTLLARQLLSVLDNRRLLRQVVCAQEELRHQAFHDPLTGLANRALFADRLDHGLELHRRSLRGLALLYCDLDNFKSVNDTLGHEVGDELLRRVAERLRAVTRTGDTVARMGGDEFAILLEDGSDARSVAARTLEALAQPASIGRHTVPLGASIGIVALAPVSMALPATELLQRADAAMYSAKRNRSGAVEWTEALLEPQPAAEPCGPAVPASSASTGRSR